ncbi:MAG: UDP-N-acetylmuramate dehydrogenase [Chitinophagaceae bacterium]|nr:UDP-N-acetylmuramate dehydrogenase [Chitinophagaceae bacterium]
MKILREHISLLPYNTFGIAANARWFGSFSDTDELEELLASASGSPSFILGGGSNILLTKDIDGLVLKNEIRGVYELHEDQDHVYVKAGAGENWHEFVQYCLKRNWAGIENLSLIPGNVGASPMQNIGAYGVEVAEVFWSLEAFHLQEKKVVTFVLSDCQFGYRESVFKNKYKGQFVILNVTYRLRKKPVFHTSYGAIQQELERMGVKELSIQAISQAVINIRSSKLPDPKVTGNAGSFFKNPEIRPLQYELLKEKFPDIVAYSLVNGNYKLAAGWLIEQCGWKGYREGDAGVHPKQALVLVNYGNASGKNIYELSEKVLLSVKEKFGVELEREVNII